MCDVPLTTVDAYFQRAAEAHRCVVAVWRTLGKPHYHVVHSGNDRVGDAMWHVDALAAAMKLKIRVVHSTRPPAANSYPVQVYPLA